MVYILFHILFHIFCYDIWLYFSHIMLHHKNIYFIHKIHHRKSYALIKYFDTHDAHIIENIVQPVGLFIPYILSFNTSPSIVAISFLLISIRGLMRHDDRCSWLIGNHHLLHHKYPAHNFGEYWLDVCFGTIYPNKSEYIYGKIYN